MVAALLPGALYLAALLFLCGMAWRVWTWASTPEPFRIPTTTGQQASLPAIRASRVESPSTRVGAAGRLLIEALLFRSLFRHTKPGPRASGAENCPDPVFLERKAIWVGAMAFHWSLLVIVLRHLRLFVEPVPRVAAVLSAMDGFFEVGSPVWYVTDVVVVAALCYLLLRRLRDPLLRYLTLPADYLALGVLLAVTLTGVVVRYFARTDLVAVRQFTLSVAAFAPVTLRAPGAWLVVHVLSASLLLAVLPFSKMVHAAGIWLSPTRNQPNDSRRRRHVNPWNAPAPIHTYEEWEDEFREKLRLAGLPIDREGPE
jgi:nitrate reductase gamma subunit